MKFGPFLGINNLLRADELTVYERGRPSGQYLRHAFNFDLDNAGRLSRRAGVSLAEAMAGAHSLWSDGIRTLYVRDSALYEITDFSPVVYVLLTALSADARMSYEGVNGDVYFSNGSDSGRLLSGAEYPEPWSLAVPAVPPVSLIAGTLNPGTYLLSIVHATAAGEEGGASPAQAVELLSVGGIRVTIPSSPAGADNVHIYLSAADGGVLTRHSVVAGGSGPADLTARHDGAALTQEHLEPQPAGHLVAEYHGRLLVATGSMLTYSQPRTPGKYLPTKGVIPFPHRVTNIVPCGGGVYVTTKNETWWLPGDDIADAPARRILPYGAAEGSRFKLPTGEQVGWYGDNGVIVAGTDGVADEMQSANVATDTADVAAVLVREVGGVSSLVVVLSGNVTTSPLVDADITEEVAGRLRGL